MQGEENQMTKSELLELLERMYDLRNSYSDEQISQAQYEYYTKRLRNANFDNEKETIRDIVYELDISLPIVARKIAYPFHFASNTLDWMSNQIVNGYYYCEGCKMWHPYRHDNPSLELTIDHEPALSVRFNSGEYKLSRQDRERSYNDTNHLQLICRSANSSKGGVPYDTKFINEVFIREL